MPSFNFLPPHYKPQYCEWLENWKIEYAAVASSLGFSAGEITAALTDANWALFVCRSAGDASSFAQSWTVFRDDLINGDPSVAVGAVPGTSTPTAPVVPAPLRGINARIRATVKRVKASPAYTQSIGQALRIVGSSTSVDPATARPKLKVKSLPMFASEVGWVRGEFSGVLVQCERNGETTDLGVKTGTKFVDNRAPLEAGKPEVRNYRSLYVLNGETVGQWSDVVSVTVQP